MKTVKIFKTYKKQITFMVKLCVTLLGLYLVLKQVDLSQVTFEFSTRNISFFAISLALSFIAEYFATKRLQVVSDAALSTWEFLKINLIGKFFNLFLPTSVGGDVVRAVKLGSHTNAGAKSTVTVFIDRLCGLTVIAIFSLTTFLITAIGGMYTIPLIGQISIITLSAMVGGVWLAIYIKPFSLLLLKLIKFIPIKKVKDFGTDVIHSLDHVRNFSFRILAKAFLFSIYVQIAYSGVIYFMGQILHLEARFYHVVIFRAISDLLLLIPISINGVGLREYIFVMLYGTITDSPNVILLSPLQYIVLAVQGIMGGIIYAIDSKKSITKTAGISEKLPPESSIKRKKI